MRMLVEGITAENICTELGHLYQLQDATSHFQYSNLCISFGKYLTEKNYQDR